MGVIHSITKVNSILMATNVNTEKLPHVKVQNIFGIDCWSGGPLVCTSNNLSLYISESSWSLKAHYNTWASCLSPVLHHNEYRLIWIRWYNCGRVIIIWAFHTSRNCNKPVGGWLKHGFLAFWSSVKLRWSGRYWESSNIYWLAFTECFVKC